MGRQNQEPVADKPKPRDIKERTFEFALGVVRLCRAIETRPGVARTVSQQLLRAGTSIGANVEEAQAGQSRADFISKYAVALRETRETIYWLRLLDAAGVCLDGKFGQLVSEADEIAKIVGTIILKTKSRGGK